MKLRTVLVILIIVALGFVAYIGIKNNNTGVELLTKTVEDNINTELLQVRAKVKVINEQSVVKADENLLRGEKLKDSEIEYVQACLQYLKDKELIKEDEENFDKYYLWDKNLLEELGLSLKLDDNSYVIVNYITLEIIVTSGFKLEKDGSTLYKLSEINVESVNN